MNCGSRPVRVGNAANAELDKLHTQFGLPKKKLLEMAIMEAAERWPTTGLRVCAVIAPPPPRRRGERAP